MAEDDRSKRPAPAPKTGGDRTADPGASDRAAPPADEIADADLEKVSGAGPVRLPPGIGDRS